MFTTSSLTSTRPRAFANPPVPRTIGWLTSAVDLAERRLGLLFAFEVRALGAVVVVGLHRVAARLIEPVLGPALRTPLRLMVSATSSDDGARKHSPSDDPRSYHTLAVRYAARQIPSGVLYEAWPADPSLLRRLIGARSTVSADPRG